MKKQEDSKIVDVIKWIKKNRKSIFATLIIIAVIVLIVSFVYFRTQMINSAASDRLNIATKIIASEKLDQGLSMLEDLMNTYPNTPAAYRAMIMKASYLINEHITFELRIDDAGDDEKINFGLEYVF